MNEYRKKWLEGLRSGNFKQGYGCLKYGDSYCCLAVACEVLKDDLKIDVTRDFDSITTEYNGESVALPEAVQKALGISNFGRFKREININSNRYESLSQLNDQGYHDFKDIADIIEVNFKNDNFLKGISNEKNNGD